MVERIYAIYDKQAQQILKGQVSFVLMFPNDAVARRTFTEVVMDKSTPMAKYPDDYVLLHTGSINIETGEMVPASPLGLPPALDLQCHIMTARDVVQLQLQLERESPSTLPSQTAASATPPTTDKERKIQKQRKNTE